jgi:hypothetical protein
MRSSASTMIAWTATAEQAKRRPWASVMNGRGVCISVFGRPTLLDAAETDVVVA